MSAERIDPEMPDKTGKVPMSDGEWVFPHEVLHYGVEDEPDGTDDEHLRKLKIGAYSAASLGIAIFGGIKAYKHLKEK